MGKIFAQVGTFDVSPDAQKGIHLFEYEPETAKLTRIGDYKPHISAGQSAYNASKDVLYITHENMGMDAGAVYSLRLDHTTGQPQWLNECRTYATLPAYICITASEQYAIVPHHSTSSVAVKTVRKEDGSFDQELVSDDSTVVLIPLKENGELGEVCDVVWHRPVYGGNGQIQKFSHLHCCVQSPDGKLFLVCDTGLDMIYSYHVDEEKGRLNLLCSTPCEEGSRPRYLLYHPSLPFCYQNSEKSAFINVWKYDGQSGDLNRVQRIGLLETEEASAAMTEMGASDLCMTRDGKFLYAAVRGVNRLASFSVQGDGRLKFLQSIDCGGQNPRGICLSPDERFLFSLNRNSGRINCFSRGADGTLTDTMAPTECTLPCNMQFISYTFATSPLT